MSNDEAEYKAVRARGRAQCTEHVWVCGVAQVAIFDLLRIPLVHGWLADPADELTYRALRGRSYNQLVEARERANLCSLGRTAHELK